MSQAGSALGGSKGGSKAGGSQFSHTSSFHKSAMAMTGDSVTIPAGGVRHPQRFQSFVGPKRESVTPASQSKGWVQDRLKARPLSELNEIRETIVRMAFKKLDKNGSGEITVDDLRGVYDCSKHPAVKNGSKTEDEVLSEFLLKFEDKCIPDGTVTWEEFLRYYKHMSNDIPNDDYFVLLLRKAWQI